MSLGIEKGAKFEGSWARKRVVSERSRDIDDRSDTYSRASTAMDSTCAVCGNMSNTPAAANR